LHSPTPVSLYVHVPFCRTKCGYCDFFSVPVENWGVPQYLDRVRQELHGRIAEAGCELCTVFIGGGTPTVLAPQALSRLLEPVSDVAGGSDLVEFTVEANPGTVNAQKADILVQAGVNRVSMGAQSFLADELAVLDRLHSPKDIAPAVATVRQAGLRRINLDLIFGIPGQTLESWRTSLDQAIELGIDHIACYGLTYEPETRLTADRDAGRLIPCDEGLEADMYTLAIDRLEDAGLMQYEISNFARSGAQCLHNLIYWRNEPYIGVGASAVGCLCGRRYKNVADVTRYIEMIDTMGVAEVESEQIDNRMLITEMIMMQLRMTEGLSLSDFRKRTEMDALELMGLTIGRLEREKLITVSDTHIALTQSGRLVADSVIVELASAV